MGKWYLSILTATFSILDTNLHVHTTHRLNCNVPVLQHTEHRFISVHPAGPHTKLGWINRPIHFCKETLTFSYRASNDSWCVKRLSQSVCPEALSVQSDAHRRLPGGRERVGREERAEKKNCLKRAASSSEVQWTVEERQIKWRLRLTGEEERNRKGWEKRKEAVKKKLNLKWQLQFSVFALPIDLPSSNPNLTLRP